VARSRDERRERDEAQALLIAVYEFDVHGKPCDFAYVWGRVREMMASKSKKETDR
jgi:hypothetical protein